MGEDATKDDEKDQSVKPGHKLLIKSAILMPSAKADEVTIVQIESEGYNKQKVVVPICAMKGGSDLQQYVDLLVPSNAKFTLLQGEGPINLLGSHCVDFFGYNRDTEADSEEEEDAGEDEVAMEEGTEKGDKKTPSKQDSEGKKRKSSDDPKSAEKKKESPAK